MAEATTTTLPVLPIGSGAVLPGMVVTITIESDDARRALEAVGDGRQVLLVPRPDGRWSPIGVLARIEDRGTLPDGGDALVVRAETRVRIGAGVPDGGGALRVAFAPVEEPAPSDRAVALAVEYRAAARMLLERVGGRGMAGLLREARSPGALADTLAWWPDLAPERKVTLLETLDPEERLTTALAWLKEALAEIEVAERLRHDVSEGMERSQREYLLRQQLAAIRRELGEGDDDDPADDYRTRLAELDLPEAVRQAVTREIDRLERTGPQAAEHGWIRTWLDTVLAVPWGTRTDDDLDLHHARAVLDADHTGLDEVKARVIELLAVRKLRAERGRTAPTGRGGGAIVTLVGPPGVGKTSLGESVARALGRRFVRVALGGVRDEAEIRGHRRTYVGAQPGRVVRALTEAGTMNPVFLLDEIDKVGADWRGDPAAALLEVLDPAQNHAFRDHYLEVDLDLSDVVFLATANVLDTIPAALLDRMEVIRLDGYTDAEKVAIARQHLLPRQVDRVGLDPAEVDLTDAALAALVEEHTREPGVRALERAVGTVLRRTAARVADGAATPVVVDREDLRDVLGRPRFHRDMPNTDRVPGVVHGLAVTGAGGDVLVVEATAMDGDAGLALTGQLGDVMHESGQIALSFIRAHRQELEVPPESLARQLHVHVPAGAVPKDGPYAGVAMTTALVSLLTGRPARRDLAMTGEVTLHGRVLPIGGVKQKLLAAHRAGLRAVVIPEANEGDLDDVPEAVLAALEVHVVADVRQVLALALGPEADTETPAVPATEHPAADAA